MDTDPARESRGARPRILIIDDSGVVRRILKRTFEEKLYEVEVAENGEAGVAMATASRFDLVVIDGMMPGMDGFEVCRELSKTRQGGRPLLVMHTNLCKGFDDRRVAAEAGADGFVLKVLDGSPLVKRVAELLAQPEVRAEA